MRGIVALVGTPVSGYHGFTLSSFPSPCSSWNGQHGVYLVQLNGNIKEETFSSCNICDEAIDSLPYKAGTSGNAERHLKQKQDVKNPRDHPQTPS